MPWHICKTHGNVEESIISFCHVVSRVWSLLIRTASKNFYPSSHLISPICSFYFYYVWPFYCERRLKFVKCPFCIIAMTRWSLSLSLLMCSVTYFIWICQTVFPCMHWMKPTWPWLYDLNVSFYLEVLHLCWPGELIVDSLAFLFSVLSSGLSINAMHKMSPNVFFLIMV